MVPEEARSNNKRQKDERTIYCLPSDIIERVFLTLPFSTLLRCARVCKQWRNFIHDPEFVASQLQHAPQYALLFFQQETVSRQRCPSDAILVDEALSQSTCAVPVIGPDEFLFGLCNGLLALYTKTSTIKIANFSTGQCLHLEKPVKNLRGDHFSLYTFGFHPATKQYKITHFLRDCTQTGRPHNNDNVSIIQVYTLGDEKWKDIPIPIALNLNIVRNSGVVNNDGTLYWLTEDMIANCRHAIMSFDVSKEIFARIQLPEVLQDSAHGYPRRYWIREIDGKMCIATAQTHRYVPRWLVSKIHVWTLDHNKSEHMWNHKYNIHLSSDCILGPNFVHWDRIIIRPSNGDLFASEFSRENYDTNFSKTVMLLNFSPRKHNLQSHNCVKSLVRLDIFKKAGIVHRPKQWEGWELKKWQFWEQNLYKIETMWCRVHQEEHKQMAFAQSMRIELNRLLPQISDDAMRQYIGIKIDQILPAFSNQFG
nr:F-box protein CPR1-like [Lolium perenne]